MKVAGRISLALVAALVAAGPADAATKKPASKPKKVVIAAAKRLDKVGALKLRTVAMECDTGGLELVYAEGLRRQFAAMGLQKASVKVARIAKKPKVRTVAAATDSGDDFLGKLLGDKITEIVHGMVVEGMEKALNNIKEWNKTNGDAPCNCDDDSDTSGGTGGDGSGVEDGGGGDVDVGDDLGGEMPDGGGGGDDGGDVDVGDDLGDGDMDTGGDIDLGEVGDEELPGICDDGAALPDDGGTPPEETPDGSDATGDDGAVGEDCSEDVDISVEGDVPLDDSDLGDFDLEDLGDLDLGDDITDIEMATLHKGLNRIARAAGKKSDKELKFASAGKKFTGKKVRHLRLFVRKSVKGRFEVSRSTRDKASLTVADTRKANAIRAAIARKK